MSLVKVLVISGASIITAGSTAEVATRDKWLPLVSDTKSNDNEVSSSNPKREEANPSATTEQQKATGNSVGPQA